MTDLYTDNVGASRNGKIEEMIKRAQYQPPKTMSEELKELSEESCYTYNFNMIHLILPPIDTFRKLCISYDKTYLFITTFFRITIFLVISKIYYDLLELNKDENWNDYKVGFLSFFIYACINILLMFIILFKTQRYPKIDKEDENN